MHLVTYRSQDFFLAKFGATIKQLRTSDRISRVCFGKLVGLSVFKVNQLEAGKLDIDLKMLRSITNALSITPTVFFEINESNN